MTVKDMLGRSGVVSREEALRVLSDRLVLPAFRSENISISSALGRVLAANIISPEDLPDFDRSTMDGYAVRSSDTFGAAESRPALLTVVGDIPMGAITERAIGKGETMKIATGGALPPGADAVVMFEQTQPVDTATIEVFKAVAPQENLILAGDDIKRGITILSRGHKMRPQDMGALAGVGITSVAVFQKPTVSIISTGNEVVPASTVPGPGRIRDTNSYNLEGLILQAGGIPVKKGIIPDNYDRLCQALESAIGTSALILITGGSSVGTADLTAKVINDTGRPGVLVHGVAIKPGKPLIIAMIETDLGHVPVFGLPGHPAAVNVCFELFVKPVLMRLAGEITPEGLKGIPLNRVKAKLARGISSGPGREDYVRVTLEKKDNELWARPIFGPSGLISTLVNAVGMVIVPADKIGIEAGEEVEVSLF